MKTPFKTLSNISLLVTDIIYTLSFCFSRNIFILPSLSKVIVARYRILDLLLLPFSLLKVSFHHLVFIISVEMLTFDLVASLKVMYLVFSTCFYHFLFAFDVQQFDYDVPVCRFFTFILLKVLSNFWFCDSKFFTAFGKFLVIVPSNIASATFSSSLLEFQLHVLECFIW